jgi:ABC-type nitrate/sulfonate/bicarbonate transport system permease component
MARVNPIGRNLLGWISVVVFLAAWEILARSHVFTEFLLPSFSVAFERLIADTLSGELLRNLGLTLLRAFAGFAMAAVAGIVIGVSMARVPVVRWFFDPVVSIGLPMPKIAFIPVFILWFGVFDESKILMIAFNSLFPVVVATMAGAEAVDRIMIWSARSLGASPRRLLFEIAIPAALPEIFTGLQIAMPIALIVAVVTEMAMGGEGLGGALMTQMRFADSPGVFSGILAIGIAGSVVVKAMELIRRRLLVWHQETQTSG